MSLDSEEYYCIFDPPFAWETNSPMIVNYRTNDFEKALLQIDGVWGLDTIKRVSDFRSQKGSVFFDLEVDRLIAMVDTIKESPYRVSAAIEKVSGPKFGLIKKTGTPWWAVLKVIAIVIVGAIGRHRCNYPRNLSHLWNWIKGTPFEINSVFRCKCGKVWQFKHGSWIDYDISAWKYFGGEE